MELTKNQIKVTKGIAILFMLLLHLFCTKDYQGKFVPLLMIGQTPLVYYLALFGDCCVAIYCFCSGYGLFLSYKNNPVQYVKNNLLRLLKLYINFWIILILFVVILGPVMGQGNIYPGNWKTLLLTFLGIKTAYNGAWWFLTTYIILVITSPISNKIVESNKPIKIVILSFIIYFIAYLQRIKNIIIIDNQVVTWIITQAALWGTSQFPFIVGSIFAEKKIYSKIKKRTDYIKGKNIFGSLLIIIMIIGHGFIQSLFIAPFTGIAFIIIFNIMNMPNCIWKGFDYLSSHSTNMWLTHMFFYMIYFKDIVYAPQYPVFIFIWLVILSIGASYIIKMIYNPIVKEIDRGIAPKINGI